MWHSRFLDLNKVPICPYHAAVSEKAQETRGERISNALDTYLYGSALEKTVIHGFSAK